MGESLTAAGLIHCSRIAVLDEPQGLRIGMGRKLAHDGLRNQHFRKLRSEEMKPADGSEDWKVATYY